MVQLGVDIENRVLFVSGASEIVLGEVDNAQSGIIGERAERARVKQSWVYGIYVCMDGTYAP